MKELFELISKNNLTIASAESFTGGMFASEFTNNSGASKYFLGSFVTYTDEMKSTMLGIDLEIIKKNTAVSKEVALLMAENTAKLTGSDIAVSFTGYAPPLPSNQTPLSFICITYKGESEVFTFTKLTETNNRIDYKKAAITEAAKLIIQKIK